MARDKQLPNLSTTQAMRALMASIPALMTSTSVDAEAITPDDSADLPFITVRGIFVGAAGDIRLSTPAGTDIVFRAVAAGTVLPVRAAKVWNTGTTAGALVALY